MKDFVFISGNPHKAEYLKKWLELPVAHQKFDLEEPQSLDLKTVTEHKARQAYALLKRPVLVEDIALTFTAMGRLPGTLIRWFLEELSVGGLCKLAAGLDHPKARAEILYCWFDGHTPHFFYAKREGVIAPSPRGTNGFGWGAIFIPEGHNITFAEMTDDEFRANSHRGEAISKLKKFLEQ